MENVHQAIAWYQTKIGSYDKQLWEQSVEKKLQKQPPFVLNNAPRKKVRLKTEYIDVDLIRGSTFTKTKPQVPWVYITRKAVARVLFFPFYYTWWVHQTSKRLYGLLLVLYVLQLVTVIVYLRNFDHGIMADELCFTEVILPTILMFLLCLIHSQTVLAHINHKPPKRNKNISGVTRKPHQRKASRRGRSSGNNSTCQEDGANTDTSRSSRQQTPNQNTSDVNVESHSMSAVSASSTKKNQEPPIASSFNMEKNILSHSVSDYELKSASSAQNELLQSSSSSAHHCRNIRKNDVRVTSSWHGDSDSSLRKRSDHHSGKREEGNVYCVYNKLESNEEDSTPVHKSGCSYNLLDNLSDSFPVEKVCHDTCVQTVDQAIDMAEKRIKQEEYCKNCFDIKLEPAGLKAEEKLKTNDRQCCVKVLSEDNIKTVDAKIYHSCVNINRAVNNRDISKNVNTQGEEKLHLAATKTNIDRERYTYSSGVLDKSFMLPRALTNEDVDLDLSRAKVYTEVTNKVKNTQNSPLGFVDNTQINYPNINDVFFEYPSVTDNLNISDFEMVDHNVTHEKHSLELGAPVIDLAACSFIQAWENDVGLQSSSEEATANSEVHHIEGNIVSLKPRPLKSQDSSDSGINNEVTYVDCGCVSIHKDTDSCSTYDCSHGKKWQTTSTSGLGDDVSLSSSAPCHHPEYDHQTETSFCGDVPLESKVSTDSSQSQSDSFDPPTVKTSYLPHNSVLSKSEQTENVFGTEYMSRSEDTDELQSQPSVFQDDSSVLSKKNISQTIEPQNMAPMSESSSQLQCFSELFVQEILNEDTLREMSCTSLLAHSDLENSSSSVGHLSTASTTSSASNSSSCCKVYNTHHIPHSSKASSAKSEESFEHHHHHHSLHKHGQENNLRRQRANERIKIDDEVDDEKNEQLDESLEHINVSDGERPSDDVSNYNPSDSDADSDGPVNEDICNRYEEKWKRLRFQEQTIGSDSAGKINISKANTNIASGASQAKTGSGGTINGNGSRSVVGILTRKPSPLKDLAIGRKSSNAVPVPNSSGSDQNHGEARNLVRRRRRTSGTPAESAESNRTRNVPTTLGLGPTEAKETHVSSSDNETGGARTPEGSNKATMSSEEWEDRIQSDETTSSAYSSNSEVDSEEKTGEEEKTEYTTSTLHVINLLQPGVQPSCVPKSLQQSGSPSSSGNITQPDKVSCVIWEGNECKKVDLTALDIGWAIIDKVDSLPESSDYFLIGLSFSFIISMVPLVFRAYVSRESASLEDFLSWSSLMNKLCELPTLVENSYSWRQYLLMVNGILQRFFLSLIFFFLLAVADRTFKQRLLYAKHFSYLTSSRRARKFSMPHFRLNKVRNIKIWLSLRSYLKRRGPQRSVDVIVSACFLCAVCTVCLISLQMLKDTDSYLDYLCNWELLVWCTALGVFLMRFMTVGLKINKKYRNLSVLITEQINLYLQMEQKPHKKEELILANNVLRLAEDLLKELESPFKISGFSANPLIYNIMRVVVLSAFSAVLTEVLGFKLKLHKIKLKA